MPYDISAYQINISKTCVGEKLPSTRIYASESSVSLYKKTLSIGDLQFTLKITATG